MKEMLPSKCEKSVLIIIIIIILLLVRQSCKPPVMLFFCRSISGTVIVLDFESVVGAADATFLSEPLTIDE